MKHIKFIGILLAYLAVCYLIGFDWLYFGVLIIADYFYWKNVNWTFWKKREKVKRVYKSKIHETASALLFAIVGATMIHTFVMQPFTIPTPSMEKSMLVGDYLLVSKLHYGPYVPNTPLSLPFMHNTVWGTKDVKPYSEAVQTGYHRMPGFGSVENNDIVVFNYPEDKLYPSMPFDKKTHYVKRCIAIPGDRIEMRNRKAFVNGKELPVGDRILLQHNYLVQFKVQIRQKTVDKYDLQLAGRGATPNSFIITMTDAKAEELRKMTNFVEFVEPAKHRVETKGAYLFPKGVNKNWDLDNFGPIYIPKKGESIELTELNVATYKETIAKYENHLVEWKEGKAFVDGTPQDQYTFEGNYYWMMGDNRHNSLDSRYWGFVPESHIVGKPVFNWLSLDANESNILKKIRFDRMFTTIHGEGKPFSFFWPVMILIAIWQFYKSRKKKKKIA
ncbi:MAG: signal peptidase I [Flavobacteriales bacterium]|jgi:signal peptidase I|nr:signal peptidase I [Flavobacteriales bacterium]